MPVRHRPCELLWRPDLTGGRRNRRSEGPGRRDRRNHLAARGIPETAGPYVHSQEGGVGFQNGFRSQFGRLARTARAYGNVFRGCLPFIGRWRASEVPRMPAIGPPGTAPPEFPNDLRGDRSAAPVGARRAVLAVARATGRGLPAQSGLPFPTSLRLVMSQARATSSRDLDSFHAVRIPRIAANPSFSLASNQITGNANE